MGTVLPLSEAKSRLSEIADIVYRTHDRVNVTRNGREYVVIMSVDDLESLEATIELLSDHAAVERIAEAKESVARGEGVTRHEMAALMQDRQRSGR